MSNLATNLNTENGADIIDPISFDEEVARNIIPLNQFISDFGDDLLGAVKAQNPPIYTTPDPVRAAIMDNMPRRPYDAQQGVVQAVVSLLVDQNEDAAIINAEMGTGKTLMGIATAEVMYRDGYKRILILSPPHLTSKWSREVLTSVKNAKVWVLNGPETLAKLLKMRAELGVCEHDGPEYFILGRVRMRMGFHWKTVINKRKVHVRQNTDVDDKKSKSFSMSIEYAACPDCGAVQIDAEEGEPILFHDFPKENRMSCKSCKSPLWTLHRPSQKEVKSKKDLLIQSMCQIPTIGPKTAQKLLSVFGEEMIEQMLADNVYDFINLMDDNAEYIFNERRAMRIERSLSKLEFEYGQGGYQPTEFIKRYLPDNYFNLMIVDECHEYKNGSSAQGQAMGVLSDKAGKILCLSGTLMGGYASDIFYLLWRILGRRMREDGYRYNDRGSLGAAAMAFMREHGVLKDIFKESDSSSHKTSRGKKTTVRTSKAPGFGPKGIARYVLPYTVFLKLRDLDEGILPDYSEELIQVDLSTEQKGVYDSLALALSKRLKQDLARGDTTLMGVVTNTLLRWPETCFRPESVVHPRTRELLAFSQTLFSEDELTPKEMEMVRICKAEKAKGRRSLIYTIYTGKKDVSTRYKCILEQAGFKVAVLRSSVPTDKREDWIFEQVDRGIDALISNPELVKTGLDLLEFPSILFMQSGYNVYTVLQAARRSWRIGQKDNVVVRFLGYIKTAQQSCLELMSKKISVAQSTSGDMPETGLDILNQGGDSIEVELARQLAKAT